MKVEFKNNILRGVVTTPKTTLGCAPLYIGTTTFFVKFSCDPKQTFFDQTFSSQCFLTSWGSPWDPLRAIRNVNFFQFYFVLSLWSWCTSKKKDIEMDPSKVFEMARFVIEIGKYFIKNPHKCVSRDFRTRLCVYNMTYVSYGIFF